MPLGTVLMGSELIINAATTTGEVINAADGLGIRGTTFLTGAHFKKGYVQS